MQAWYYPIYNYISLTSPKAASTLTKNVHNFINNLDGVKLTQYQKHLNIKKILVCRNPYTRCLSAYYNKFLTIKNTYTDIQQLYRHKKFRSLNTVQLQGREKQWQNVYAAFYTRATTNDSLREVRADLYARVKYTTCINDSFRSYIKFLKKGWLENSWYTNNAHFKPQICNDDLILFNSSMSIVKIEECFKQNMLNALQEVLPQDIYNSKFKSIEHILNTKPNQHKLNVTQLSGNGYADYTSNQWVDFLQSGNSLASINNMLDDDIINDMNEMFSLDFKHLNYPTGTVYGY